MVSAPSLQVLQGPASAAEQLSALKEVKNDIVGHDQRKEVLVKRGLVDTLVAILSSRTAGKRRSGSSAAPQTQDDELRLQATLVLGSLANGGAACVAPLLAAGTPKVLLATLSTAHAPPKLVTAALQTLRSLASSWAAIEAGLHGQDLGTLDIFTHGSNDVYLAVMRQRSSTPAARLHVRLAADIIAISATSESAKSALAHSSVLETLAALLASYAIASKQVDYRGDISHLPSPPPEQALPSIISAICTIVTGSTYHVHRFFLSTPIRELFTNIWPANGDQRHLFGPRYGFASPGGEPLLPPLHVPAYGTTTYYGGSRAFPALASLQPQERRGIPSVNQVTQGGDADHANAVCGWLLVLARSMQGHDRLVTLRLLALVNHAIDADVMAAGHRSEYVQKAREREKQLVLLAVPLAVTLVRTASEGKLSATSLCEQQDARLVKEEACDVLALLIRHCKELQVAAVDAGAIKHASSVLKKSFDNVPLAKPMWSARSADPEQLETSGTRRMGSRGLPSEILHAMRCRQGALEALAAIASKEDVHRKAIVEAGVVACIIEALKPYPVDFAEKLVAKRGQVGPKDGNTTGVILAACQMAKTMSRSVSLLRTSLIDAGIAKPILQLLLHQDMAVQLAATDVCINILSEFSPMRDDMIAEGIVKTLTEHARSSSPALRLSSLWALKHLVLSTTKEVKVNALEELGTGWLVAAIQGESREAVPIPPGGGGVSVGLSTPNAAGEQVDLLNPSSMDVDEPADDDDEDYEDEDEDGEVMYDESSSTHYQASQLRSTLNNPPPAFNSNSYLSSVREMEQNLALQAKRDDVAVQEQALDFVRNLLTGDDCAYMTDHLLTQIGSVKIFDMLTAKLLPLANSLRLTGSMSRQVYNPIEIVLSTVHIINHFANALPRHKQLLIAQKSLLQAWLPHFGHVDRKVRVMSVWAINSLTWIEDDSDRKEARQRALELRAVGIEGVVKGMANDPDLDVKERVKTAVRQFDLLI
ncbi:hypothetical protein LTR36_000438 [Oleoguttula mirabilis]|uniref:Armadillo repeat-containing protein 8 n=1 Tax=Oleoguttula mirabilis TaxID=1507867 RepID=A0AAV9JYJ0_9PEZI|nr:hypothetical protein LTR36_000438 [Oleoguttula mirabilis]